MRCKKISPASSRVRVSAETPAPVPFGSARELAGRMVHRCVIIATSSSSVMPVEIARARYHQRQSVKPRRPGRSTGTSASRLEAEAPSRATRWRRKMSALVGDKLIAIVPVLGWWDQRTALRTQEMKFSLIVSVFGPGAGVSCSKHRCHLFRGSPAADGGLDQTIRSPMLSG